MSDTRVTIKGWPEELAFMLEEVPVNVMPELYFEYLLLLDAMYYTGRIWVRTQPEDYHIISEVFKDGNVVQIWRYERND